MELDVTVIKPSDQQVHINSACLLLRNLIFLAFLGITDIRERSRFVNGGADLADR